MLEKSGWDKLIERTPLAVVVIGVLVFVIGAAGGLPIGPTPLVISDLAWRFALGVLGFVLIGVGVLLLIREEIDNKREKKAQPTKSFLVKTYPRSQHPAFFADLEKLVPQATEITLIATGLNLIWEKRIVDILIERAKTGKAKITICMGNPFSPHVLDRLIEEETTGERAPVGREGIERNVKALLQRLDLEGNPAGFTLCLFEHYPTFATFIFDNDIFVYPYAYQVLGNVSPILHLRNDGSEEARFFTSNAERIVRDAVPARDVIAARANRRFYSNKWIAAAVYIVPEGSEPIYKFGSSVLGYDIWRQKPIEAETQDIADIRAYVGEAAEFGFHATIADALYFITEAEIERVKAELRILAEQFYSFKLSNFRVVDRFQDVGDIVLLCEDRSGVSEALHYELVARMYSMAISSNYLLGRTRKKNPQPLERAMLMTSRYGSPYVLKKFEPHFTLCAVPPTDSSVRNEIVNKLQHALDNAGLAETELEIDALCLLTKRNGERYWRVVAQYPLCKR